MLSQLSMSDYQSLCDWGAGQLGGYGTSKCCTTGIAAGNIINVFPNQAACVAALQAAATQSTCMATVGQWQPCAQWALGNLCASTGTQEPANCTALLGGCQVTFAPPAAPPADAAACGCSYYNYTCPSGVTSPTCAGDPLVTGLDPATWVAGCQGSRTACSAVTVCACVASGSGASWMCH